MEQWLWQMGWTMLPLLAVSVWAGEIVIERLRAYSRYSLHARDEKKCWSAVVERVRELGQDRALIQAQDMESGARAHWLCRLWSEFGRTVAEARALREEGPTLNRQRQEYMRFALSQVLFALEKRLGSLALIARMAPLLGLLGTVVGLIRVFMEFSRVADGEVGHALLAGGIYEALITTVTGLVIALPVMMAHRFFVARLEAVSFVLENYSYRMVTLVERGSESEL
jgi:biopolymer transport protein ExbB